MADVDHDSRSWTDRVTDRLADAGHRPGGARRELLELMAGQRCALSAFEIEARLAAGPRRVSRASIYRILEELEAVGAVQRVDVGAGITRYEPLDRDRRHHHHLVCDRCGSLAPFTDEALERAVARVADRVPLAVSEHEIVLHGTCADCAETS
ncbi:MAG TPA: Fur family transcriptional regulator [Solirubrobacteraceae bacterium]|nr:Fur family transcriptional regulator [Solirubrobacteraceae bacterium]